MNFTEAIQTCFSKYANFNGRAKRSEYWYFVLFQIVGVFAAAILGAIIAKKFGDALNGLFMLATFIPSLAVCVRRLHDTNRSAWFLLLYLIPVIGSIILLVWLCQDSKDEDNKFNTDSGE